MTGSDRQPSVRLAVGLLALAWSVGSPESAAAAPRRSFNGDWQGACEQSGKSLRTDMLITEGQVTLNGHPVKGLVRGQDAIHFDVDGNRQPVIFTGRLSTDGTIIRGAMRSPRQVFNCSFGRRSRSMIYGGYGMPKAH